MLAVSLLALLVLAVLTIVTEHRHPVERRLRATYGIDRDWWVPLLALGIALGTSLIEPTTLLKTSTDKLDIIALIFAFSLLAAGLRESGAFTHITYRLASRCNGQTLHLILALYVLTSFATLVTTNDVVVLALTPVIIELSFQTRIANPKLLLLSQFIAANTLSMALLVGSPTNLLIADTLGIDFFSYAAIMIPPAVVAALTSLAVIRFVAHLAIRDTPSHFSDLQFESTYDIPGQNPEPFFTRAMKHWVGLSGVTLVLVAAATVARASLVAAALPAIMLALALWQFNDDHTTPIRTPLRNLPFGILFFGLTFFTFAAAIAESPVMTAQVIPVLDIAITTNSPVSTALLGVFGSGVLVNVFNDLPAAALIAEILPQLNAAFPTRLVLVQAVLAGVNVSTYITHIGALAGLLWFNQMRVCQQQHALKNPEFASALDLPTRADLIRFGLLNFLAVATTLTVFFMLEWMVLSIL